MSSASAASKQASTRAGLAAVEPLVSSAVAFGVSQPVRDITPPQTLPNPPAPEVEHEAPLIHPTGDGSYRGPDPVLQQGSGGSGIAPASQNFEGNDIGESSSDGVFIGAPPDTNGDVGPDHYVQTVNTVFSVYSKTGTRLSGPTPLNALWESAPNADQFNCTTQSRGDPIAQYDPLADRWLISQFNFPGTVTIAPPFDQCIAISRTPDPTGAYFLYDFRYSTTIFNDYPHFGVWPDAYYMSVNQFDAENDFAFASGGACAYERAQMLAGDPDARQVCFDERQFDPKDANGNFVYGGQLPADLDGNGVGADFTGAPPAGAPNPFLQFVDSTTAGQDKLLEFRFHVDWANPANSTFGNGQPNGNGVPIEIPVPDFGLVCNGDQTEEDRNCIPQKDSPDGLDAIGDRLMYRLAYRNFGTHESLVANHTVNVGDSAKHAGIRWYEIRNPNGTPTVHQASTYAPDAEHRWMGSIAMDQNGNIALGYSLSSASRNPAIAYTARRAADPLGQMTLGEGLLYQGLGAQEDTGFRWGDYSSMSVDPNGCTFWYTQEHYLGTGSFNWGTRIGSFTLPNCGDPQISLSASSSLVRVRGDFSYTIGVTTGQSPVQSATVTDVLPPSLTLLSVTSSTGTCQGTSTVVCNLGDLPAGDLETITLEVHARETGTITNTATLSTSSPDSNLANNTASSVTQVFDSCIAPGAVMATDPTGDQAGTTQQDLTSVAVAEPFFAPGTNRLVFTLKVQNLSPAPQPNSFWYEHFSYGGVSWFVNMETRTNPTSPTFNYGFFAVNPATGLNTQNVLGTADAGTFSSDGTITITLSNSKLDPDGAGPKTPPGPGSLLAGVHGETRTLVGVLLILADSTSGGGYTLSGNDYCAPNTPPTASLSASPTSGSAPLTVLFNASASSDPDPGDSVASYTFRFGDGSTPVTQSGATISHTYSAPGSYHATLTVTDSRGQESENVATQDIQVTAPPSADLMVVKTGPATGKVGQSLTYTIVVTNKGPSAASGVTMTDSLPKNAGVGSVSSTQGSCAPRPKQRLVVCTIGSMASGARVTVTLVVKPTQKGAFKDTATVSATSPSDPVSGNNSSSVTTQVSP
jgi:uncharacterized repeat protein (TIGR01451 family)